MELKTEEKKVSQAETKVSEEKKVSQAEAKVSEEKKVSQAETKVSEEKKVSQAEASPKTKSESLEKGTKTKLADSALKRNKNIPQKVFKIKDVGSTRPVTREYKERVILGVDELGNRVWGVQE